MKGVLSTKMVGSRNLVGNRVREARLALKPSATQTQISERLREHGVNLTFSSIGKIEQGLSAVTDKQLLAFSKVLEMPVLWLMGLDEQQY